MHALAHTLNDSPRGAPQGLPRRCLGLAQGAARACLGLAQGLPGQHPNLPRFAPLAAFSVNHGRIASISAVERLSLPIDDSHPPSLNGPNSYPPGKEEGPSSAYELYPSRSMRANPRP
jgi:hypothetical protein